MLKNQIEYKDFDKVDIRVGTVMKVENFTEAHKPAYKVWINFGDELGMKQSSAQIKKHQKEEELIGKQVVCVVNFAPKQIGPFTSEVLILGAHDGTEDPSNWVILRPLKEVPPGSIIK